MFSFLEKIKNYIAVRIEKSVIYYIKNQEVFKNWIYIIIFMYILWSIYYIKYDIILLLIVILTLLYLIKYIQTFVNKEFDPLKKVMMFNLIFLFLNILTIFFNILRNVFQDIIIHIRKYFFIKYNFNNIKFIMILDNIMAIISWNSCYTLIHIYILFHLYILFFDFEKKDMEDEDFKDTWIMQYKYIFRICFFICNVGFFCVMLLEKTLHLIKFPFWVAILIGISGIIFLIFMLNNVYVVFKFYKRNK